MSILTWSHGFRNGHFISCEISSWLLRPSQICRFKMAADAMLNFTGSSNSRQSRCRMTSFIQVPNLVEIYVTAPQIWTCFFPQNGAIGPLSVLSQAVCLSVTFVYCGQTVGWIRMPLGMEVGLGPGHIVLDGNPTALPPDWGTAPHRNRPCRSIVAKRLEGSRCHLVWR